jgi:hypothetical protein
VEITFDSQLSGWIWEGAFPLIPRAWDLQIKRPNDPGWVTVDRCNDNVQRRVIHTFPAESLTAARIVVRETQGGHTARIVEVRCYGPNGR